MRRPDYTRRVAVTGLGIISPIGQDIETAWTNLVEGNSGLKRITRFDASIYEAQAAGEVNDFDPNAWMNFKEVRRTDRNVVLGVAAAKMALADSGLEIPDDTRDEIGVIFGSGGGGPQLIMDAKEAWDTKGARTVSPFFIANMLPDTASGQIAIETGIRGPNMCVVTACSTGTHNIGEAAEGIRRGDFIAALTGATESPLHEIVHVGFSNIRGMGPPRPPPAAGRPARGAGHLGRLRRAHAEGRHQRHEVADRAPHGRRGRSGGHLHRALGPPPGGTRHAELPRAGSA